jgi:hypothetical protein
VNAGCTAAGHHRRATQVTLTGKGQFIADVFKVLCIDSGGLRGITRAMVLAEIEERVSPPI